MQQTVCDALKSWLARHLRSVHPTQLWSMEFNITGTKKIGPNHPCFVIAEVGQNHQGDFNTALRLIDVAKECGADCVKFQKTCISEKFSDSALKRRYDSVHSFGNTYGEHRTHLEFNEEQFVELKSYSGQIGIPFAATPKDRTSLRFLNDLGIPFIKIGSGDCDDIFLLDDAIRTSKPLVISTGMMNMTDVKNVYHTVKKHHSNFCLLHCVSSYPTEMENIHLRAIQAFQEAFTDICIGFSGHEKGFVCTVAAVALGAKIVERHITLDKTQKGSDHACSLIPEEFKEMVENIRTVERALGEPQKIFQKCEYPCFQKLGKCLVANNDLPAGHTITWDDLRIQVAHPMGIPARQYKEVIGRELTKNVLKGESITVSCFQ